MLGVKRLIAIGDFMALPIGELGRLVHKKREGRGIRSVAAEAEVSPATLSRIENGNIPDLATFAKICRWLEVDPAMFLGIESTASQPKRAVVHFRKDKTVSPDTAESLAELILSAQRAKNARLELMRK
jgi:transcriptional regulator with XRE-family HTH domain